MIKTLIEGLVLWPIVAMMLGMSVGYLIRPTNYGVGLGMVTALDVYLMIQLVIGLLAI